MRSPGNLDTMAQPPLEVGSLAPARRCEVSNVPQRLQWTAPLSLSDKQTHAAEHHRDREYRPAALGSVMSLTRSCQRRDREIKHGRYSTDRRVTPMLRFVNDRRHCKRKTPFRPVVVLSSRCLLRKRKMCAY